MIRLHAERKPGSLSLSPPHSRSPQIGSEDGEKKELCLEHAGVPEKRRHTFYTRVEKKHNGVYFLKSPRSISISHLHVSSIKHHASVVTSGCHIHNDSSSTEVHRAQVVSHGCGALPSSVCVALAELAEVI